MPILPLLILLAAPPLEVEVATLAGEQFSGRLRELTTNEVSLEDEEQTRAVPVPNLLEVRIAAGDEPAAPPTSGAIVVNMVDGSRLVCGNVTVAGGAATLNHPVLGSLEAPLNRLASLRFGPADPVVDAAWNELAARNLRKDELVVRKGDVLDHLGGVVGPIDATHVNFVLDGDNIPVKREKIFGLLYARPDATNERPLAQLEFGPQESLPVKRLAFAGERWRLETLWGAELTLPAQALRRIDFSLGKVRYLSSLEPRDVEYTKFYDIVWKYARDRTIDGEPLRLGNREYSRGLCLHSRTRLRYRIGGEFRRFQAVMGIDDALRRAEFGGDVDVTISGDGKVLLAANVTKSDPPQPIDLDVSGVIDLEILVDFGSDELDIADHLDLADARVVK